MTFTPRTWVVGEVVGAALLNLEVRDQWNSVLGAWTSYTPAWTATTTNPVLNNGLLAGRVMKVGRTCHAAVRLSPGTTTTYGSGAYLYTLPYAAALAGVTYFGVAWYTGAAGWVGAVATNSTGLLMNPVLPASATDCRVAAQTRTTPESLASTHDLRMSLTYQTAS